MSEQKNNIISALREPLGDGGRTAEKAGVDSEDQMHHAAPPTEAIRKIWTKPPLIVAFAGLFVMNFAMIFAASSAGVYDPYATSHFKGHSLIATANIIHGIVRIVAYPLLAKVADHIGRPQGFAGSVISMALANVLYAACHNVETYLAGGIFESFGDTWWTITEQIFIAEVTSLMNRGFLFTLPESLAALPTLYAGTYLGEHMLLKSSWRWGFGMWAAIMPFCALPTIAIMVFMEFRARKKGIYYKRVSLRATSEIPEGASWTTKVRQVLFVQLDIVGAFLLLAGLAMTLLPLSITGRRNTERWTEPSSIVLLVVGVLTFFGFLVWDGRYAKKPIVPFRMIKNRNVILACVSVCDIAMSDSTYRTFAPSFLQVAGGYSPGHAVRIDNARRVALNLGGLVIGLAIRFVKHTKPIGGALWNTLLPRRLATNLPEIDKANSTAIFRSIVAAQSYEPGTATRDAINLSYRLTQQTLAIGSLSLSIPLLIIMFFFRNVKLEKEDEKRNEVAEQQLAAAGQGISTGQNTVTEKS
ncbi:hypothetical protein NW757_011576 [Fusarium falciforme]|nr:hypothetical protein NW757_011576 [Fusarium falciforme]